VEVSLKKATHASVQTLRGSGASGFGGAGASPDCPFAIAASFTPNENPDPKKHLRAGMIELKESNG
jgi:hypothetical protein